MPNTILEAHVRLAAEDSQLRATFQGLAPAALLAGKTTGERYAEGMLKAARQAHAAFTKEFVGPLQGEAFGSGIGRGMQALPTQQYRASDLATQKGVVSSTQAHGQALGMAREKAEAFGLSVREATHSARLFGGTILSSVNPQLGEMGNVAGEAIRTLKGLGPVLTIAGTAGAIAAVGLITYISRVKETLAARARLDQAIAAKDPAAASGEVATRTKALEELITTTKAAAQLPGGQLGLFGTGRDAAGLIAAISIIGKSVDEERKKVAEAQKETDAVTRTVTFPQIEARAAVEANQLLVQSISLQRQNAGTLDELADSTRRLRAAKEALVEASIREIEVNERVKAQNIFDAAAKRGAPVAQDVQDKILGDIKRRQQALREGDKAAAAEDRRQANADRVAIEERQRAHAVELGRISMADQLEQERAATVDMGRTVQEREAAEKQVFQTRRQMADAFITFQQQLTGKGMFKEQIEVPRGFMSELVSGSAAWFAQVSKVSDLFTRMREDAKGVFGQQASIAESRASFEGKTTLSISDVPDLLRRQREQDERALRGDQVRIGDISGAVGRVDLFRKMDKEGLSPREAFARMMEDPAKQLARALGEGASEVTPALSELTEAAQMAAAALRGIGGGASGGGAQAAPGFVRRPPGGPTLSEENRQAILDTVSTGLQEQQLAVYGRR